MRTSSKYIGILACGLFCFASPTFAGCTSHGVIYGKFASGYIFADVGSLASGDVVVQGGHTSLCDDGHWSGSLVGSAGPGGHTAYEIDGSLFYNDKVGPVAMEFGAQYYALNVKGNSMLDASDDTGFFYGDFSWPITFGKLTVAPLVRVGQSVGVRHLESQTLIQPGIRGSFQLDRDWQLSADIRDSSNLTDKYSALRVDANVNWQFTEHSSAQIEFVDNSRVRGVWSISYTYKY